MSLLRDMILSEHSRENRDAIVDWVGYDTGRMAELMNLFFDTEKKIAQRAAWPVGEISRYKAQLIMPYLLRMFENLKNPVHDAVIRLSLRSFQDVAIPEELEGPLYEICFNYLNDTKQPIAIRVFSMNILTKIATKFPDLIEELMEVIQIHVDEGSAGYKSVSRKNLKKLSKLIPN
jgi:hypothetical protein